MLAEVLLLETWDKALVMVYVVTGAVAEAMITKSPVTEAMLISWVDEL